MPKDHSCQARQYNDQMLCGPCGLAWDANDPPPECRRKVFAKAASLAKGEPQATPAPRFPDVLPRNVCIEMENAYRANMRGADINARIRGMQAAYRVLLDRMGEL